MRLLRLAALALVLVAARPVKVVEWVDFQCPFCREFARRGLPSLLAKYGESLEFEIRHMPVESLHPGATLLSEGAECAREQDLFMEYHDAVFRFPGVPSRRTLGDLVEEAGGARPEFEACLRFGAAAGVVEEDLAFAVAKGIRGTPHFTVDEVEISGWGGNETLERVIDAALAQDEPLTLRDLDPPLAGRLYVDEECGDLCTHRLRGWLEKNFPTLELETRPAPADASLIAWAPYIEVDQAIREATRFPEIAPYLMARGGEWVLRPDALLQVHMRDRAAYGERPRRGPEGAAPVTLFTSFTCPWCAKQNDILREIEDEHPVEWRFVHYLRDRDRDLPLSIAAECAWQNGGDEAFWPLFDALFTQRPAHGGDLGPLFAEKTGLPATLLEECRRDPEVFSAIVADQSESLRLGIAVTPASGVGDVLILGLIDGPDLAQWILRYGTEA